jgi:hypothetical protein
LLFIASQLKLVIRNKNMNFMAEVFVILLFGLIIPAPRIRNVEYPAVSVSRKLLSRTHIAPTSMRAASRAGSQSEALPTGTF